MKKLNWMGLVVAVLTFLSTSVAVAQLPNGWRAHDLQRPLPPVVDPGDYRASPAVPSDAVVLFDGTNADLWQHGNGKEVGWKLENGYLQVVGGTGNIQTRESFGDCQLHIEWASPEVAKGNGQGRGNSGVFFLGQYEVQVLDSFDNTTYADGSAAALYGQHPPLVNASRGPGQWQAYDIIFRQPVFHEDGTVKSPAMITVLHNGVLVQEQSEMFGPTNWILHDKYQPGVQRAPIQLQDHGDEVRFRNIWIRELGPRGLNRETPEEVQLVELTAEQLEKWLGDYNGFSVQKVQDKVCVIFAGKALEMLPLSENEFRFSKAAGGVKFTEEESGKVVGVLSLDAAGSRRGERKSAGD